ncbi:MAG: PilZ domain-containing protein [Halioglobus sp.]|nr:PilZ domain-containing protein [Halioglobus sp.]
MSSPEEKRSYYRIHDYVGLSCARLDDTAEASGTRAAMPPAAADSDLGLPLSSLLSEIDRKFNPIVNSLWLEHPPVAETLGLLNRKISILAARVLDEAGPTCESYEELLVSLSGSGIGFNSAQPYPEGARLRLFLALKPSSVRLDLTGVVIGCDRNTAEEQPQYWVRVAFEPGNEAAQEQLIQHVVQRQCAQIHDRAGAGRA